MSRRWSFALLLALCAVTATVAGAAESVAFYVSPKGNDKWSGTRATPNLFRTDGPFASLVAARDAVRKSKARGPLTRPVTVRVLGGVYRLTEPLVLEPGDSGTTECPITYVADDLERPVFTAGRMITGWRQNEKGTWTVTLPEVKSGKWYFQSLFVNGERRQRARTPNDGYFRATDKASPGLDPKTGAHVPRDSIAFRFKPGDIKPWDRLSDINVVVFHAWATTRHRIASVDTASNTVEFTGPSRWPFGKWGISDQRYYIENLPEALDAPGEWYLDRRTGVLSYIPLPGENLNKVTIEAPILSEPVQFRGDADAGKFVEHVKLSGLAFVCTDWVMGPEGHNYGQAAPDAKPAVALIGARHCTLEKIEIAHVGGYGIGLGHGCNDNRIEQCHLHDLGAGGVLIGEMNLPREEQGRAARNTVHNCFIHDGGHIYAAAVGIWVGKSSNNVIQHNEISDFYYTGMSVGWSWGYQPSSANGNIIEYNHVHHLGFGVLSDMGGIYTLGVSPGTRICSNVFHHIESYDYGGWGIYTDEGSTDILIENNIAYCTKDGNFHQHYGKDNIVRNNIFAFSRERQIVRTRQEKHRSFVFEHNIVYYASGVLLGSNWSGDRSNYELDYNVYWDASGRPLNFAGSTFEEWKAKGQDLHSINADPLFRDAAKYDFRLKPESPALKIGFKPIDVSKVGLVGPLEWIEPPKSVKRNWPQTPAKR